MAAGEGAGTVVGELIRQAHASLTGATDTAKGLRGTFVLRLQKKGGGKEVDLFWLRVTDKGAAYSEGPLEDGAKATATFTMDEETLAKLLTEDQAISLFTTGKVKLEGDMMVALKMNSVIQSHQDRPDLF
eukprot:gnl/TRDRNA2_/TRDRNA2_115701_c0_seq2.p1 gnl/TRDRNA2_/TRDRNA2_115701_c0~~gnl/TRDRNA2_/TRDRNA2_115701_c0_seq2.p1  ORF type:complete len:130 (-),score=32.37 gnl/TRDRNA2_/TRDRNA2_115701_c0_seq2:2-391(-)